MAQRHVRGRVAALALALTPFLAPAAPAAAAPVPSLAGFVTLSGSRTGYVTVRLPEAAELLAPATDDGRLPRLPFATGRGRYLGYVLSDDKPDGIRILAGVQTASRYGPYALAIQGIDDGETFWLPAGQYRLYLLADGAPATVTLRFKGLPGATSLRPAVPVPYTLASPTALVTPGGTLGVGGAEGTLEGRGLAFDFLSEANQQFLASNTQLCFYEQQPPPQPVGYGPGCPGGEPATLTNIGPGVGGGSGAAFSGLADLPEGRYGLGFNRVGVGITDALTYTAGFLTFDGAGSDATPGTSRPTPGGGGTGPGGIARSPMLVTRRPLAATGGPAVLPVAAVALGALAVAIRRRRVTA